jgi:ribosomal protein L11 methyltransferase
LRSVLPDYPMLQHSGSVNKRGCHARILPVSSHPMFSLEIACAPEHLDLLIAELWEQGCAGISELDDGGLRVFFEDAAERDALLRRYPGASSRTEEQRDWVEAARDLLQPMNVGARFFLVPEWRDDAAPPGRFRITVNPGLAFGTGVHETTRLCLEALEDVVEPGMSVLDVGTGSGILAEAAALLGAGKVFACDVDPVAVQIARARCGRSFAGSADAVRSGVADVAIANISPEAIIQLAPDLMRSLRPGGVLLASGFEAHEVDLVKIALPQVREVRRKGTWALAVIRRS